MSLGMPGCRNTLILALSDVSTVCVCVCVCEVCMVKLLLHGKSIATMKTDIHCICSPDQVVFLFPAQSPPLCLPSSEDSLGASRSLSMPRPHAASAITSGGREQHSHNSK